MGCDIHTRIEYLNKENEWVCGDFYRHNPYYGVYDNEPYAVVEVCGDRDYLFFAMLADVRNYDDVPYIDDPRGIPDDVCEEVKEDYEGWEDDAHSASWFTLKELIEWNHHAPPMERNPITHLIEELKRRGEELNLWWDDDETMMERADRLRFVFWFDN